MATCMSVRTTKQYLIVFNVLMMLISALFIVVGSVSMNVAKGISPFISSPAAGASLVITVGVLMFLIAFVGLWGAIKEGYCLIVAYSVTLGLAFVLQLSVGVFSAVQNDKLRRYLPISMNRSLSRYSNSSKVMQAWDFVQTKFSCCGIYGPADWDGHLVNQSKSVPSSCCKVTNKTNTNCGVGVLSSPSAIMANISTNGCLIPVVARLTRSVTAIGIVNILQCVVQVLAIVFASILANEINKTYEYI